MSIKGEVGECVSGQKIELLSGDLHIYRDPMGLPTLTIHFPPTIIKWSSPLCPDVWIQFHLIPFCSVIMALAYVAKRPHFLETCAEMG